MFPDLSYILHYFFGTEPDNWASIVKTFGLLLAIAILVSAYILYIELKRKEKEGLLKPVKVKVKEGMPASASELILNAVLGFLLGYKILYILLNVSEFRADASGVILSAKGSLIGGLLGAILLAGLKYREKQRKKLPKPKIKTVKIYPHDRIGDITIISAISGVIGAKIFDIVENLDRFFEDPIGTFFSGGGLAIYGGLIVAFIVMYFYLKKKEIPPIYVLDAVAPALIIGYGIGRLGCHFSGDGDWGIPNTADTPSWWFLPEWLWAYDYPNNVAEEGVPIEGCTYNYCNKLDPPVYPTSVYETAMAFAIGGFLWFLRKRITIPGVLFCLYLIFNGLERFLIEKIRVNIRYESFFNMTQAEIIAIVLFLLGTGGIIYLVNKNRK